jgi:hypothetical protein
MWHTNTGDRTLEGAEAQAAIKALDGKKCGDFTVKVEEVKGKG